MIAANKRRVMGTLEAETAVWVALEAQNRRVSASWIVGEAVRQYRNRLDAARTRTKPEAEARPVVSVPLVAFD